MCVSSLITWYHPNGNVMLTITFPSKVISFKNLSWQCHLLDLALKPPTAMTRKGFLWTMFFKFNSKFLEKVSKSSKVRQRDLQTDIKLQTLSPIFISNLINSEDFHSVYNIYKSLIYCLKDDPTVSSSNMKFLNSYHQVL